ncbi:MULTISPECIES: hypothetical protein [unclassified Mycolicibacterium]|uniref:hypothetical protein n=1 Tax=unclassified Mycolicibacterium TaxID=2636767 RepID=UPI001F4C11AA|nr:hypothetical protein [Mycolicibacterium sp. YH-1]UNB52189.1 hypothetical protein L0M16_30735 [Mycolicibacterium sp. YH-1]
MNAHLQAAHWIYLIGIVLILVTMMMRRSIVVPAVLATFLTAAIYLHSFTGGLAAIFNASLTAARDLFSVFLIIAVIVAMFGSLRVLGADKRMVAPFRKVMRTSTSSFIVLALVTYVISLFFFPTPAVPLVGAVLIPVAIRAGLSPISVGMVIAIAGQGMALSSDYIIKVAPGISAKAAGVEVDAVANRALVLSLIVGVTALLITYVTQRKTWKQPSEELLTAWENKADAPQAPQPDGTSDIPADGGAAGAGSSSASGVAVLTAAEVRSSEATELSQRRKARSFAILVPVVYLIFVIYLILGKVTDWVPAIVGADASAMIGGIAILILFAASAVHDRTKFLEDTGDHITDGFLFVFKAMGVVIPIAGFFYLGNQSFSGPILALGEGVTGPALLFDLIESAQQHLPTNAIVISFAILLVGLVAGLEGSGFTGLPLTGSLAGALAPAVHMDPATLAAVGQIGSIWSGGGTLVAWSSLVAVAGFARVPVMDLARKCFIPVMTGLVLCAMFAALVL